MKVLLLPKYYEEGASSRYRLFNYEEYFKRRGHLVHIKPLLSKGYVKNLYEKRKNSKLDIMIDIIRRIIYILNYKKEYDVLIIEKELFTNLPYFIEKLVLWDCVYTLDFDDAISINYKMSKIKRLIFGDKINRLSNRAKVTTVGNRWYSNEITMGRLSYLPTVIDLDKYKIDEYKEDANNEDEYNEDVFKEDMDANEINEDRVPVIVWIGSPSTAHYLKDLAPALKSLSKSCDFILRVIGAELDIDGIKVECFKWSEEDEFELLNSSDIGIMPLAQTQWENGKCGFKLIQYMAACLPTVASPAPANNEITLEAETGFIAESENQWIEYLEKLCRNKELRTVMGRNARKRVEECYSYQVWGDRFVDLIEEVVFAKE